MVGTETCCSDTFFLGSHTSRNTDRGQTLLSSNTSLHYFIFNWFCSKWLFFYTFLILLQWCHRVAVSTPALHICFTQRVLGFTIPNGASSGGLGIAKTHCGFFFFLTLENVTKNSWTPLLPHFSLHQAGLLITLLRLLPIHVEPPPGHVVLLLNHCPMVFTTSFWTVFQSVIMLFINSCSSEGTSGSCGL